ncbi:conserved hypothetical protein [Vibrio chagasii]|nr:conserved hypothetical protein [Vibrio chagasii]CAH6960214.1 conserved hypothetical protein [Vibrio chagasii]CAH7310888.1 conserved hypothetical protein [Vibrio chagasii]CAH7315138.1 conserved hypothetical protein [Vibrio chagasii]CAH7331600.1 conserved hypothetical protein [Vibrio chagasii]
MGNGMKLGLFALLVAIAYGSAWLQTYQLSEQYNNYAQQQLEEKDLIIALKGMNKLELRQGDEYLGGFQQVLETWEKALLGPSPSFYDEAKAMPEKIIAQLDQHQLEMFIETYVELDARYVPEAAERLRVVALDNGDIVTADEMSEFLLEAFPNYQPKSALEQ